MTKLTSVPMGEDGKKFKKYIDEYVDAMLEEQAAKDLQSSVLESVDNISVDKAFFKKAAKIVFDHRYNDNKTGERIKNDYEILESVEDILK